jgi:hypothetical protein
VPRRAVRICRQQTAGASAQQPATTRIGQQTGDTMGDEQLRSGPADLEGFTFSWPVW